MPATSYLDYNATAPVRPAVIEAVAEAMRAAGNASSVHRFGRNARRRVEQARTAIAALVNAPAASVVFTSGGTEANNLALRAAGRGRLLVSAIEHASVLDAVPRAERIAVGSDGTVDLAALEAQLGRSAAPALVAVMLANNETGVIQPIADVVRIARAAGALVLCDAVQAAGKIAVDAAALGADYVSLAAHKLGGPQGVGALIVREGAPLAAQQLGGGQERSRRAGTENVAGIVGFGVAAREAATQMGHMDAVAALRDAAQARLLALAPQAEVFGGNAPRLPNTLCIEMPGVAAETQVMALDLAGVAVSAGAACSSGKVRLSPVLLAMGVEEERARCAIRISFGWDSVVSDVDRLVAAWGSLLARTGSDRDTRRETAA